MLSIPLLHPGESPADRARRLTEALAAAVLSDLVQAGIVAADLADAGEAGVRATQVCRRTRVRVVVRVLPWKADAWETTRRRRPANSPPASSPSNAAGNGTLRDVEDAALQAAPGPSQKGISIRALARKAGYRDSGHFREAVRCLIDRDLLRRVRGGIIRTVAGEAQARNSRRDVPPS